VVGQHGRDIDGDMPAQRERWLPQWRSRLNAAQPCARLQSAEPTFPLATGAGEEEENGLVAQCGGAVHTRNSDQFMARMIHHKDSKTQSSTKGASWFFVSPCRCGQASPLRKQIKTTHRISMGRGATGETTVRSLDPDYPCESARVNAMQQVQGQQQQLPVERIVGVECCAAKLMVCLLSCFVQINRQRRDQFRR
jgi:hypothetical protein